MDTGRKTAFEILLEIETSAAYSNLSINKFIQRNAPPDPAFVRELVYGVLENRLLLDYYLDKLIASGISRTGRRERTLLRLGLYQLIGMESVPEYAAVNETVALARRLCRGREGFINGVLRGFIKKRDNLALPPEGTDEYLSVRYSFPLWLVRMWKAQYGSRLLPQLLAASNERAPLTIRPNSMRTDARRLSELLTREGFVVSACSQAENILAVSGSGLLASESYAGGLFSVQDEGSYLACTALAPRAGETVIDVCAAPGGKTCALAELMGDEGRIIACDIYQHRLDLIEQQAGRLGLGIISTRLLDGTRGDDALFGTADRVLADVPCSGLGVIRRKPEIKYKEPDREAYEALLKTQSRLLQTAASYLKPQGTLVYSTCTINKEENDFQIQKFVEKNREYEIIEERQFFPTEGIDGFYICKLKQKGN